MTEKQSRVKISNTVGEFLFLFGTFYARSFVAFVAATSMMLGSAYSL